MTLLCAPEEGDLHEIDLKTHKLLKDKRGTIQFIDVDWQFPVIEGAPLISSYHNYIDTPTDLDLILATLKKRPASIYKIATMAHSALDAMRMLKFVSMHSNVIGICMGIKGQMTRILSPVFQMPITYASNSDDKPLAPGQLSTHTLIKTYNFYNLNNQTKLYTLIGDPVEQSIGHKFHNSYFKLNKKEAVYFKTPLTISELGAFMSLAKQLKIQGISITMPLKEAILPFLDYIDETARDIGAVNTVLLKEGLYCGFNTDGLAALKAIGEVAFKKIVILGSGGTAKAIRYWALKKGAVVSIVSRSPISKEEGYERLKEHYDILVNATPNPMPIDKSLILSNATILETAIQPTSLLMEAHLKGCRCISGEEMFYNQALDQQLIWQSL